MMFIMNYKVGELCSMHTPKNHCPAIFRYKAHTISALDHGIQLLKQWAVMLMDHIVWTSFTYPDLERWVD